MVLRVGLPVPACRQFYAWPAARVLARRAADADLLHAHLGEDVAVAPIALAVTRRRGLPLVLTVHTSVRQTLTVAGPRSALLKDRPPLPCLAMSGAGPAIRSHHRERRRQMLGQPRGLPAALQPQHGNRL